MNALINRFSQHTTAIFERHGMTNEGYWRSLADSNTLIYVLSYPDMAAREKAWKDFGSDPEWQKVAADSEKDGKIVAHVESVFMKQADFWKKIRPRKARQAQKHPMVFELRTYTCAPGRLPALLTRFSQHTIHIFKKHAMTSVVYWTTVETDGQQSRLVYILAHPSEAAAKVSWAAFQEDPEWKSVKQASEKDGKIVEKVESVFMAPLPFSRIK